MIIKNIRRKNDFFIYFILRFKDTKFSEVIDLINKENFDIDGIELSSNHIYENNFEKILKTLKNKKIINHNYFLQRKILMILL